MNQGWLNTRCAAKYACVSPRTIHNWLKSGLKSSRVGGLILIRVQDLDAYLEGFTINDPTNSENVERIVSEVMEEMDS